MKPNMASHLLHVKPIQLLLFLLALSLCCSSIVKAQDRGFSNSDSRTYFTPERTFDVIHMKLEPSIDILDGRIDGISTTTLTPINDGISTITFDAANLQTTDVTTGSGIALEYRAIDDKLEIDLDRTYNSAETLSVIITYTAHPNDKGLYFVRPDDAYPNKRFQVWSQGEMEESRYWFPCWDSPNDKLTTEMIVTVEDGFKAISNGALIDSTRNSDNSITYHWRENIPHVYYLVSLVIGEFAVLSDSWNGIPINYYAIPEDSAMLKRSFSKTPDMMEFFSNKIGIPYPYEKYAQVTVQDFVWGGMENISATTMTQRMLHDQRAHQDYTGENLVAHELAHQWWGNLITTKNWSNAWLNEGLTSYFDLLYMEHDLGHDEFMVGLDGDRGGYFSEDKRYRRNIVTNLYEDPEQMFDSHTYRKGAAIVHMIRNKLGDKLFWKAINHYAKTYREQSVETNDFRQAIEDATGKPLEKFFKQWVYSAGHPELKVSWTWNANRQTVSLNVEQTQKVDSLTPLFDINADIDFAGDFGSREFDVQIANQKQSFVFSLPSRPAMVEFDRQGKLLMKLTFKKSKQELLHQLKNATTTTGRLRAATALKSFHNSEEVTSALAKSLTGDKFWKVRAQCATTLGKIRSIPARDALIAALNETESRARVVTIQALGEFDDDGAVASALRRVFGSDDSYKVRAEALRSLAKIKADKTYRDCQAALKQNSYRQWIRSAAFNALVELKDKRGIDLALKWSQYGKPTAIRTTAIASLPKLAKFDEDRLDEVREHLIELLEDNHHRARSATINALGDLGDPKAIPYLKRSSEKEPHFGLRKNAKKSIAKIHTKTSKQAQIADLKKDIEKVKDKNKNLQQQIDNLQNQLNPKTEQKDN